MTRADTLSLKVQELVAVTPERHAELLAAEAALEEALALLAEVGELGYRPPQSDWIELRERCAEMAARRG